MLVRFGALVLTFACVSLYAGCTTEEKSFLGGIHYHTHCEYGPLDRRDPDDKIYPQIDGLRRLFNEKFGSAQDDYPDVLKDTDKRRPSQRPITVELTAWEKIILDIDRTEVEEASEQVERTGTKRASDASEANQEPKMRVTDRTSLLNVTSSAEFTGGRAKTFTHYYQETFPKNPNEASLNPAKLKIVRASYSENDNDPFDKDGKYIGGLGENPSSVNAAIAVESSKSYASIDLGATTVMTVGTYDKLVNAYYFPTATSRIWSLQKRDEISSSVIQHNVGVPQTIRWMAVWPEFHRDPVTSFPRYDVYENGGSVSRVGTRPSAYLLAKVTPAMTSFNGALSYANTPAISKAVELLNRIHSMLTPASGGKKAKD